MRSGVRRSTTTAASARSRIRLLEDSNGDGLIDLVIVNNSRSKITLLYNQTGKTNLVTTRPDAKREINELPPGARFRIAMPETREVRRPSGYALLTMPSLR